MRNPRSNELLRVHPTSKKASSDACSGRYVPPWTVRRRRRSLSRLREGVVVRFAWCRPRAVLRTLVACAFVLVLHGDIAARPMREHTGIQVSTDSVLIQHVRFQAEGGSVRVLYDLVVKKAKPEVNASIGAIIESVASGGAYPVEPPPEDVEVEKEYSVRLFLRRESDPGFLYEPEQVSGDVGVGPFAGMGRAIVWDMQRELPMGVEGNDFYFEVHAEPFDRTDNTLLVWAARTVAVIGGGVLTYLVLAGSGSGGDDPGFPRPPGRPR